MRKLKRNIDITIKEVQSELNRFDCNIKHIFDGAYSNIFSYEENLKMAVKKYTKSHGNKCIEQIKLQIDEIIEDPYSSCFSPFELNEIYNRLDKLKGYKARTINICNECGQFLNNCPLIKALQQKLVDEKDFATKTLIQLEKAVNQCVQKTENYLISDVNKIKERLKKCSSENFNPIVIF